MIVLDTNVASELMRPAPSHAVAAWLDRAGMSEVYLSSITWLELKLGVELLPSGKRKAELAADLEKLRTIFDGRILPFDVRAAEETARCSASRRAAGRGVDWRDTRIAGIAVSRSATLATRNVRDFEDLGLKLVNPWTNA